MDKNYDDSFISAQYDHYKEKDKHSKRRKKTEVRKANLKKNVHNRYMMYVKDSVCINQYETKVIPARVEYKEKVVPSNNIVGYTYIVEKVEIPAKLKRTLISITDKSIKPYIKDCYFSGCRQYAKNKTNNKYRTAKIKISDDFDNFDDYMSSSSSTYRKIFDYWNTIF